MTHAPEFTHTTHTGHIECPDCGESADLTVKYHLGEPGRLVTIDCPNCEYYESFYDGPDV